MSKGLSRGKIKRTKNILTSYEDVHPAKTAEIITEAIVDPESEKLHQLETTLTDEIQRGKSQDTYYLRQWRTLCNQLSELEKRYTELRKYKPSQTPSDVPLTETEVITYGSMTVYELQSDEHAVIVCQNPIGNTSYQKMRLKVVFTESATVFFRKKLRPNRWFRPKDVQRTEPDVNK
jgi:hypothetical protein